MPSWQSIMDKNNISPNEDGLTPIPVIPEWVHNLMNACERHEAGFYFEEGGCFAFAQALFEELVHVYPQARTGVSDGLEHAVALVGPIAFDHQGALPLTSTYQFLPQADETALRDAAFRAGHSQDAFNADLCWARAIVKTAKEMAEVKSLMRPRGL